MWHKRLFIFFSLYNLFIQVRLEWPTDLAISPMDNSIYVLDNNVVLQITENRQVLFFYIIESSACFANFVQHVLLFLIINIYYTIYIYIYFKNCGFQLNDFIQWIHVILSFLSNIHCICICVGSYRGRSSNALSGAWYRVYHGEKSSPDHSGGSCSHSFVL